MIGQPQTGASIRTAWRLCELRKERILFYMILNAYWEPLHFELPPVTNGSANPWRRWIDTALDSPLDIVPWQTAPPIPGYSYRAETRSVVVLFVSQGLE